MEKTLIAILAIILGIAMGAAWTVTQLPDPSVEVFTTDTCVPVYYSGLECCKK